MAVSYVGATSGSSGSATSTSFATSLPAGWAAGDVAILVGHVSGVALTMGTPAGLAVPVALGEPASTWARESAPDGISVPVVLGAPSTSVPGRQVHRPYTGTVARPGPDVVVRPSNGVVVRP